jgi:hypothetical protein
VGAGLGCGGDEPCWQATTNATTAMRSDFTRASYDTTGGQASQPAGHATDS